MNKLAFFLFFLVFVPARSIAQDWAQLDVYREDNKKLAQKMTMENRIVFFGNSITIGWLHTQPSFFRDKPYINRGIGGQTTPQMLVRFRQDVIDLKPRVVLILAGTNDIAGNTGPMTLDETLANLKSMTELAQSNNIAVILCSVLPASDYSWRPGLRPDIKIPKLNAMIKEYADKQGAIYLDYFSAMVNGKQGLDPDLANDGVHPTKKGYEIMAPLAEKAIKKALDESP
ncbi:MAG: acylhydrolase [Flavobacteriaceae bacterium]|nr:SGNH/GDSL hydrolase family protein [Muriicola sp.]NNC61018.1 acylhydrolase [Eudoraea sp.]NNK20668.1 acylhydrolase [Flavobacteriaceae bacterium]MBT8289987.1 SGNH/GDSL hydrolase family protein [Muriicola sp.]NNK35180.1 acylhydrolase [Eudoraea sp.]